jgi:hypothetical protein
VSAATGVYRKVWLVVASGGWWKSHEIAEAIAVEDLAARDIHNRLSNMVRDGCLVRREIPEDRRVSRPGPRGRPVTVEFAVTPNCTMPLGIRAGEAMKAMTGRDA